MTTWDCPLCPFRTTGDDVRPSVIRHATTEHPAYLPDSATIADILALVLCWPNITGACEDEHRGHYCTKHLGHRGRHRCSCLIGWAADRALEAAEGAQRRHGKASLVARAIRNAVEGKVTRFTSDDGGDAA